MGAFLRLSLVRIDTCESEVVLVPAKLSLLSNMVVSMLTAMAFLFGSWELLLCCSSGLSIQFRKWRLRPVLCSKIDKKSTLIQCNKKLLLFTSFFLTSKKTCEENCLKSYYCPINRTLNSFPTVLGGKASFIIC